MVYAVGRGHKEIVRMMLKEGATNYDEAILEAYRGGHYNISRIIREWRNKQTVNRQ